MDAPADWEAGRKPGPAPIRNWPFPSVIALELQVDPDRNPFSSLEARQPTVADSVDNALNTLLALVTFNGKFANHHPRDLWSDRENPRSAGPVCLCRRPFRPPPGAWQLCRAVDRYLARGSDPTAGARFRRLQARAFPAAHSFLCLDLAAVGTMIEAHRDRIIGIL